MSNHQERGCCEKCSQWNGAGTCLDKNCPCHSEQKKGLCLEEHCHDCAGCDNERPMTEGEAEMAQELDKYFALHEEDWEKEFYKEFGDEKYGLSQYAKIDSVKSFISTLLSSTEQRVMERVKKEIEGMEKPYPAVIDRTTMDAWSLARGYNQALSDILSTLETPNQDK